MPNKFSETLPKEEFENFKKWLREHLKTNTSTIVFDKLDGSERTMKATLSADVLPLNEKKTEVKFNDNTIVVWDVEKSAWRAVRFDSIKQINLV